MYPLQHVPCSACLLYTSYAAPREEKAQAALFKGQEYFEACLLYTSRNKCLFALGLVFAMSLPSIVAFAFSFTGEPDVKNDQKQIVVVNPATESEETTSEQTVSAETEDTTATLQSAGSSLSGSMDWDAEDAYMLAKIAMAEAESEDTEGKALVMLVVLNRVWSDEFPDTIAGVIFQDGQFSPISNGRYDEVKPDADCYRALQLIQIDGWDESRGATYFESKSESCLLYTSAVHFQKARHLKRCGAFLYQTGAAVHRAFWRRGPEDQAFPYQYQAPFS